MKKKIKKIRIGFCIYHKDSSVIVRNGDGMYEIYYDGFVAESNMYRYRGMYPNVPIEIKEVELKVKD